MTKTYSPTKKQREPREHKLPWIQVAPDAPYFMTENGEAWLPIGQNDAITWPELNGLFRRRDPAPAEAYVRTLAEQGVTCLRLMLEYCHTNHRYLERPVGRFQPGMVRLWDDLFALCERFGLRILLTPFDTYWMGLRWRHHPYNRCNGGPCERAVQRMTCANTRQAIKNRLAFAAERWGGSGALFAWDLWNEIQPSHADDSSEVFESFIYEVGSFLKETEMRLYGRAHPQTVSAFGPHLVTDSRIAQNVYRHPQLDFANNHLYESGTIDDPKNTVDAAVAVGRLVREGLREIQDQRPFFDSEHGPIHTFNDNRRTLPEAFDDEYFRHIQWAHLASGGAGGGMRWPNRHPHSLTPGMRRAQASLAAFQPLIDWLTFRRVNWNEEVTFDQPNVHTFACGDGRQAIVYLLRTKSFGRDRQLKIEAKPMVGDVVLPAMEPGNYRCTFWNTRDARIEHQQYVLHAQAGAMRLKVPAWVTDVVLAVRRLN